MLVLLDRKKSAHRRLVAELIAFRGAELLQRAASVDQYAHAMRVPGHAVSEPPALRQIAALLDECSCLRSQKRPPLVQVRIDFLDLFRVDQRLCFPATNT